MLEVKIGLWSSLVRQARFVATAAVSLVSQVLLVFGTEEDLIPLGVLEVVVDFAVRLLRGKRSTQVVLEISLQHPSVVIFASNLVIFIVLAHGVLEVVVDFAVRLLRGKQSTQVVLEISLQHPSVVIFCKQLGHFYRACPWKSRKNPCRVCTFSHPPEQCPFYKVATKESTACALAPLSFRPEVACSLQESFSGKLHLQSGTVNGVRCSVLRDTGATVCGVCKRLVQPCQLLGSSIRRVSFGGREEEFPLAKVSVKSPYFSGEMTCCVLDAPVADFIVGNVPKVPSLVSQDESCSFAAATRARSKLVVDKKPLSQVIQDLEVTPDVLSDMQRKDESLR